MTAPAASRTAEVETPTVRGALRRGRAWIVLALVLVAGAVVVAVIQGGLRAGGPALGAENAAPAGAKALVEVLRDRGVEVIVANSLDAAADAAEGGATLLAYDQSALLDRAGYARLARASDRVVLVDPGFAALDRLAPGVRLAGVAVGELDAAACDLPAALRAGALGEGQGLLTVDDVAAADGWSGCFPDDDHGYAVVTGPGPAGGDLVFVAAPVVFANETIDEQGNAALALGLLGQDDRLVWYLPGPADLDGDGPSPAELTPGWVSPLIVLAIAVALAAAVWRGRRFGPLVIEDLPVEVPAGETAEGRARLYARSASRLHAVDQLRIGTVGRLTALLRLPRSAELDRVVAATATATGRDPVEVRSILVDQIPTGDGELVELAARLDRLEVSVRHSLDPTARTDSTDRPGRRT